MRRVLGTVLLLGVVTEAQAVSITATWTARPASEGVVSYKVYAGPGSNCGPGQSAVLGTVSHPTASFTTDIPLNNPTTYKFCATAVDAAGNESAISTVITLLLNPFWQDSFENVALPNWMQNPIGLNGAVTVSSVDKTDGLRSLRFIYADPTRLSGPTLERTTPTTTELFARFWIRAVTGFIWGSPTTTIGAFGGGSTTPLVTLSTSTAANGAPYMLVQTAKESGYGSESLLQNQGTPQALGNTWTCMETRVKYNTPSTANGILQWWMDGVIKGDYQNREFLGNLPSDPAPSNALMSYVRLSNDRGNGTIFIDDLQISNARLGCAGTIPPDPSPTVIAPTNLIFATQSGGGTGDITIDTTSLLTDAFSTTTTSGSITIGSGSNRGLVCAIQTRDATAADRVVSTVTLGAQNFSFVRRDAMSSAGSSTEWWALINPASGAGTITPTTAGTVSQLAGFCIALAGMHQTTPIGSNHTGTVDATGSGTQIITTISNPTSNAWVFDALYTFNEFGITVDPGQTERNKHNVYGAGFSAWAGVSSAGPLPASVTQDMKWAYTAPAIDKQYTQSVIVVAPQPAGGGITDILQWIDNSNDETGFELQWKHAGTGGVYVALASVGSNVTSIASPITTQTDACIKVRAVRNADVSDFATALCQIPEVVIPPDPGPPVVTPPGPTPEPPTQPIPVETQPTGNLTNGRTVVSWNTPNTSDPTRAYYVVEWTNYQRGTNGWQAVGITGPNATGFVHRYPPFVPQGESHFWVSYRIKAVNTAGLSSYGPIVTSDVDVFVPSSPPSVQAPAAPTTGNLQ